MTGEQGRLFPIAARQPRGRVTNGLEATLKAMSATGRIEQIDQALIALAREAAAQVQASVFDPDESRYTRGGLIGRYHAVLTHLLARPDADRTDADLAALFADVEHPAQP